MVPVWYAPFVWTIIPSAQRSPYDYAVELGPVALGLAALAVSVWAAVFTRRSARIAGAEASAQFRKDVQAAREATAQALKLVGIDRTKRLQHIITSLWDPCLPLAGTQGIQADAESMVLAELGWCYHLQGCDDKGYDSLLKATKDPVWPPAWLRRALVEYVLADRDRGSAQNLLRQAAESLNSYEEAAGDGRARELSSAIRAAFPERNAGCLKEVLGAASPEEWKPPAVRDTYERPIRPASLADGEEPVYGLSPGD